MSKVKFDAARDLIEKKKYAEARRLLNSIDHPTAREWEVKLDKLDNQIPDFPETAPKNVRPKKKRSRLGCGAALVLIFLVIVASQSGRKNQPSLQPTQASRNQANGGTTIEPSATITDTPSPTTESALAAANQTAIPISVTVTTNGASQVIAVTPMPEIPMYYVLRDANARLCPETDCEIVVVMKAGEYFGAHGIAFGESINGGSQWYQTKVGLDREVVYVHSSLVTNAELISQPQVQQPQSVQNAPAQQPAPASGFSCPSNCDGAKAMGLSAQQAASCGLDRDGDGVACYGD